jgi:chitin synthase
VVRNTFEDMVGRDADVLRDGVSLPAIVTMDNSACVKLLRGSQLNERAHRKSNGVIVMMSKASLSFKSGKTLDNRDEELLQDLVTKFGMHSSFVASLSVSGFTDRNLFAISHYSGICSYDISGFVEKDVRLLDATFISLLRQSSDPWISKLMSGLGMALKRHHKETKVFLFKFRSSPVLFIIPHPLLSQMEPYLTILVAMVRERLRERQVIVRQIDGVQTSVLRDYICTKYGKGCCTT